MVYSISSFVSFRGMLRRPKPTDSEADLLREQEQFLTSGAPSAANVVRRPDKRRGEAGGGGEHNGENEGRQRDVVTIEGKSLFLLLRMFTNFGGFSQAQYEARMVLNRHKLHTYVTYLRYM